MISLRQLSIEMGLDYKEVRGIAIGQGIKAERTPAAFYYSEHEAEQIKAAWKEQHKRERATATAKRA